MAQTKKDGVREAILRAAFAQFSEVGYSETSIPAIFETIGGGNLKRSSTHG